MELKKNIGVHGTHCNSLLEIHIHTHTALWSYQGTALEPGVGLRAGPAARVELPYSANAVNPVCCRTVEGRTPAPHG